MALSGSSIGVLLLASLLFPADLGSQKVDPIDDVLRRMGEYVAGYGERASVLVGVETYSQEIIQSTPMRPRRLVAEVAIVRTATGWIGFRDVVEVNSGSIEDRHDRLLDALATRGDIAEATRIANESARFNIGPIARNFNVPTAALFFFTPENLPRFTFKRNGTERIDGLETWKLQFKETKRPTLVGTRAGRDVPMEGTLWVSPAEGSVVRTLLRLDNFADAVVMADTGSMQPTSRPAVDPNVPTGGREALQRNQSIDIPGGRIEAHAEIEVAYRRHSTFGLWLPDTMRERYAGPVWRGARTVQGSAVTRARYSDFKRFETSATVKVK